MTISTEIRKAGPYSGNGSTTVFPFGFKVFTTSDLYVVRTSPSGVETVLALTTNYTVSLNPDQDVSPGGSVTMLSAPVVGEKLTISSDVPFTQTADITNQGGFYPVVVENALDRATMQLQQLAEKQSRSLALPISTNLNDVSPDLPAPEANGILAWNDDGTAIENRSPESFGNTVIFGSSFADTFTGDGSTTAFTLSRAPGSLNNLTVTIDGVTQAPTSDYLWTTGTTLTFTTAPALGTAILVKYVDAVSESSLLSTLYEASVVAAPMIASSATGLSDESAAINAHLANNTRLHIPARYGPNASSRYGITAGISITRSNTHLSFDRGARFVPLGTPPAQMIDIRGAAPTSWTALSRDAYGRSNLIRTATDPGWQVGDWIEVRSSKVIDSTPNYCSDMLGECHRIASRYNNGSSFDFVFDTPLNENYLVADSAVAGKATVLENIIIEHPQFNDEEFSTTMNFAIRAQYCAGLRLIGPRGYGSKTPLGADRANGDFIKLIDCIDTYIEDPRMAHGAYYGLSIMGWTRNLRSYGGDMTDVRHAVSLIQKTQKRIGESGRVQEYGQPFDILIHGMTARNTSLSGFDTHDTGLHIRFDSCTSIGAGDDGFQFRSPKVKAIDCYAIGSHVDGFSHNAMTNGTTDPATGLPDVIGGPADCELINCRAISNGRSGANFRYNRALIQGGEYSFNGSISSRPDNLDPGGSNFDPDDLILPPDLTNQNAVQAGACGIRINGGVIDGARIEGNAGTGGVNGSAIIYGDTTVPSGVGTRPLTVRGVIAPGGATQTRFMSLAGSALNFGLATLAEGNQIDGYGDALFFNSGAADNIPPVSLGGSFTTTTASLRRGQDVLVGGSKFISNTAVRNKAADASNEAIVSRIALNRLQAAGVLGSLYVRSITDGVGFTVASTAYAEPTRTNAVRNNTNVGASTSPSTLPTNWSVVAAGGLTTTVMDIGTETGPGGGTQNYIDIRVDVGTATAGTHQINFDVITNADAAVTVGPSGQSWTASFGAKLQSGTMTGLAGRATLIAYNSGGASVAQFANPITISSTAARFSSSAVLTGTAAYARATLQLVVTNGAAVDATIRIYMPQLEQANDASAPIATSGTAATRTQDPSTADNSTFEWIVSV